MLRKILIAVVALLASFLLLLGGGYLFQEKLIFMPTRLEEDFTFQFDVPYEEFFIDAADGARLNGVVLRAKKPKGILVYYHGNAGDLSRWGQIGTYFTKHNYDVLVWDYRGFGKSSGKLSEAAMLKDAQLIYEKAKELQPNGRVIVYGRSIGAAFASHVAVKNDPYKLILESPFYSMEQLAKEKYPFLPVSSLLKYRLNNGWNVGRTRCRVILIHGDQDRLIPQQHSIKLYKVIPERLRTFVNVKGAGHNDLINFDAYRLAIYKELL